jgi:hypothetical protein
MSKFVYDTDSRTRGTHRRRLRYAIKETKKKNDLVPLLVKYLRDSIAVMKKEHPVVLADLKEHFEMLAELIAPQARKRGRPKGRDPSERAEAVRIIVARVRKVERDWKKKNPNRPFRGVRKKLIKQVFAMPDDSGDSGDFDFKNPITEDEVFKVLTRGGSSR